MEDKDKTMTGHLPLLEKRHPMLPGGGTIDMICAQCREVWPCGFEKLRMEVVELTERLKTVRRNAQRMRCFEHETDASNGWGCPVCVHEMRLSLKREQRRTKDLENALRAMDYNALGMPTHWPSRHYVEFLLKTGASNNEDTAPSDSHTEQ